MRVKGFWCLTAFESSEKKRIFSIRRAHVKSLLVALLIALVIGLVGLAGIARSGLAQDNTVFKVQGYILDVNGGGIAGAEIIFNVPDTVKSVYSDITGHYVIYAPTGIYHVNVWPPWDSSYIDYDLPQLVVGSDMTKNITLNQGCKVSGYITDTSGAAVQGAVVSLNGYLAGWYSNYQGYYFVSAPAGTYKLTVNPRSGYNHFVNYYEYNFVVNGNLAKNITVTPTAPSANQPTVQGPYKISGYILNANNHGIAGAQIIFGVPDVVPSVYSDNSGYYAIYAPAGSYHVNVWPPFDSNYIDYDQPILVVASDITKNITLNSGYKVSGYIMSTTGQPVKDGIVLLDNYLSGWFSKDTGYYFVCAPAGTYKLWASPRNGINHFAIYSENGFVLDRNIVKNITVVTFDTSTPSPSPTPEPTSSPMPDEGWISINVDAMSPYVGSVVDVKGRLTDYEGNPIPNQAVTLSIADLDKVMLTFTQIGSATTTKTGEYDIQWTITTAGSFLFQVEWVNGNSNGRAINTSSIAFWPANSGISQVDSASTVSRQDFATETEQVSAEGGYWNWAVAAATVIAILAVVFVAVRVVKNRKAPKAEA
jgi:hypothetical protein